MREQTEYLNTRGERKRFLKGFFQAFEDFPILVVAFSLWFVYVLFFYQSATLFRSVSVGSMEMPGSVGVLFSTAVSLVAMVFVYKRKRFVLGGKRYFRLLAFFQVTGMVLCIGLREFDCPAPVLKDIIWIASSILLGSSSSFIYVEFNRAMGWLGLQRTLFISILSVLIGSILALVLSLLSGTLFDAVIILLPVVMLFFLCLFLKRSGLGAEYFSHGSKAPLFIPWRFLLTSLIEGLASGILLGCFIGAEFASSIDCVLILSNILAVGLFILLCLMFRLDFNRLIYQIAFPFMAFGFIVFGCGLFDSIAGKAIQGIGYCFVDILLWGLGSYLIRDAKLPAEWITAGPSGALFSGLTIGAVLGCVFAGMFADEITVAFLVCASVILFAALQLSNSSNFEHGWGAIRPGVGNEEDARALSDCCRYIVGEYGLTTRESEVLSMLVRGYPRKIIAERLYISESTVKTHVRNMYRKLGVQTRSDLLLLIESTKALIFSSGR